MAFLPKDIRDRAATPEGLVLTLVNETKKEDFMIWDNTTKQFIRTGTIKDVNGREIPIDQTRWLKKEDFDKNFPNMQRSTKINREVLVDGEVYTYGMPKSVDNQIEQQCATLRAMGQNVLANKFKINKSGIGLQTRYSVVVVGNSPQPTTAQPVAIDINAQGETTPANTIQLSDIEQQLVGAIQSKLNGTKVPFEAVKDNFLKYNVPEERAMEVYAKCLA